MKYSLYIKFNNYGIWGGISVPKALTIVSCSKYSVHNDRSVSLYKLFLVFLKINILNLLSTTME